MAVKIKDFDAAEYLDSPEDVYGYLQLALEEGDPVLVQTVLGQIARSEGMAKIARSAGVSRESLYRSLSENGNPSFATVMKVLGSLGLRLKLDIDATTPAA